MKIDLEDKSVPAGQYSLDFLDKAVKDPGFDPSFEDNVLKNVVSYETDVKVVVSKVSLGEADAGIVYITDYNAAKDKLGKMDIPDALNTVAIYPIAPISDSQNPDLAKAFVALVLVAGWAGGHGQVRLHPGGRRFVVAGKVLRLTRNLANQPF